MGFGACGMGPCGLRHRRITLGEKLCDSFCRFLKHVKVMVETRQLALCPFRKQLEMQTLVDVNLAFLCLEHKWASFILYQLQSVRVTLAYYHLWLPSHMRIPFCVLDILDILDMINLTVKLYGPLNPINSRSHDFNSQEMDTCVYACWYVHACLPIEFADI